MTAIHEVNQCHPTTWGVQHSVKEIWVTYLFYSLDNRGDSKIAQLGYTLCQVSHIAACG